MATYLFAWNPALWAWPDLAADIARVRRTGRLTVRWNSGRVRNIEPGSRAFLVRVGVPPKGLFGAGCVLTAPVAGPHWLDAKAALGATARFLQLSLDTLRAEPLIEFDALSVPPFARFRWGIRQSGTRLPSSLADALELVWEQAVEAMPTATSRRRRSR